MKVNDIDLEHKLNLIRHYDAKAEKRSGDEWEWKYAEVNNYIRHLNERQLMTLLDVGCGTGNEMNRFVKAGFEVTGIDLSPNHVKKCLNSGLNAKVMDFYELNFPDQSFDAMFAMSSLLHVPKSNLNIVIKEIHRCMKSNGLLFVGMFKGFHDGTMASMDNKYIAMYQTQELVSMLEPYFDVIEERNFRPSRLERYVSLILTKSG